jgi:PBP1b-binding outer membrane lipoprotein LpoB
MKSIVFYIAITVSAFLLAGCNKTEQTANAPAKTEQQTKELKNIMRMDKPGPAPDPSKYKGTY